MTKEGITWAMGNDLTGIKYVEAPTTIEGDGGELGGI